MFDHVKTVLGEALQIEDRASEMTGGTPLLGNLPELDSMAVVTVLTALEDNFGFIIDDDDLVSDAFLTLDSLVSFVEDKTRQCA
ncbi:MAG: acyl carrier protein [Gammaproteobacteria bacterium]|nr:acyl carrier protein [Gammaproteobacteria bacterium]